MKVAIQDVIKINCENFQQQTMSIIAGLKRRNWKDNELSEGWSNQLLVGMLWAVLQLRAGADLAESSLFLWSVIHF